MGYFLGCDAIIEEVRTITEATAATFSSDPLQFLPVHPSDFRIRGFSLIELMCERPC